MHQRHREFGRGERLIQHAIEIFDLVDIPPAATARNRYNSGREGHHNAPALQGDASSTQRMIGTLAQHSRV